MVTNVQSLPVELLSRIFVLGAHFNYPYVDGPFLFTGLTPYKSPSTSFQVDVSQVCSTWRRIAVGTSALWSVLHFHEPRDINKARTFLQRCKPTNPTSFTSAHTLDILVATVSLEEKLPGKNISSDELEEIFDLLVPLTPRWRSFHLYVRDSHCKGIARHHLSTCGPAPSLITLQLFHFEDFKTSQDLWEATHKPPVIVFNNEIPKLKNVSLIGVNMPWRGQEDDPEMQGDYFVMGDLDRIELALHTKAIRPPYRYWQNMLLGSPNLQSLSLTYSGPKPEDSTDPATSWLPISPETMVPLPSLTQLSLADLDDSAYACSILERLLCKNLSTLKLRLPSPDFTPLVELLIKQNLLDEASDGWESPRRSFSSTPSSSSPRSPSPILSFHVPFPNIRHLHTLVITTFSCSFSSFQQLMTALSELRVLDINFKSLTMTSRGSENVKEAWKVFTQPCSPKLQHFTIFGLSGRHAIAVIQTRYANPPVFVIRCSEKEARNDPDLDRLVTDRGVWGPPKISDTELGEQLEGNPDPRCCFLPVEVQWIEEEDMDEGSVASDDEDADDGDDPDDDDNQD
ncbi:hypothetical protein C8J56DRAFT_21496 [Mycena floridula]|nr:hypothetical protein C8J56DRAFT_21496 [Mycena floridula]